MTRLTINIECDTEAFGQTDAQRAIEINRILQEIVHKLGTGSDDGMFEGTCIDANGKRVGKWQLSPWRMFHTRLDRLVSVWRPRVAAGNHHRPR